MKKTTLFVLSFGLLALPMVSLAATFERNSLYTLPRAITINDNLYTAGQDIIVSGAVSGDLVGAGASIISSGTIGADALLTGGNIELHGVLAGDARVAGGHVTIGGNVNGDGIFLGGTVTVLPDAFIKGDVAIAGGQVILAGHVSKSVRIMAGSAVISGIVDGPVIFQGGELTIGSSAILNGSISAISNADVVIEEGAVIKGAKQFEKTARHSLQNSLLSFFSLLFLAKLLLTLVALFVIMRLFGGKTREVVSFGYLSFGKSFLTGVIVFILTPIAVALLLATVLGAFLGIILFLLYLLFILVAAIESGVIFGTVLYCLYQKKKEVPEHISWKIAVPGVVLLFLVGLIPFIGHLIVSVFFFTAFGALSQVAYKTFRHNL